MKSLDPIKNCLERNRNYFDELKAIHHVSKVELFEHALTDMVKFKRIIAWTYPYKYFLEDKARIDLLEDIQGQLEQKCEILLMKIETTEFNSFINLTDQSNENFNNLFQACLSLYDATKTFCENLESQIKEGKF